MEKELPKRKYNRLKNFDYSTNGAYFVTICAKDKKCIFGKIVGDGVLDVPKIHLSNYGKIVNEHIIEMNNIYDTICAEKYIIMPNHIHLIIKINNDLKESDGTSRTPSPTNFSLPSFISALKRLTNKKAGTQLWQRSYYDHIIRNEQDYLNIWQYIENNPLKWTEDKYYREVLE